MLARTYYALNRHADAARAFDRAVALVPDNADLLADYADALGAAEGGLKGKSLELIDRALKADPTHWKALALAGTAAFDRKDYKQRGRVLGADEGDRSAGLAHRRIDRRQHRRGARAGRPRSRRRAGNAVAGERATAGATSAAPPAPATAGGRPRRGATIGGTVSLAPALAAKAAPTDTVFIFARAAEGPKMPLAILQEAGEGPPGRLHARRLDGDGAEFRAVEFSVGRRRRARVEIGQAPRRRAAISRAVSRRSSSARRGLAVVIDRTLP